MVALSMEAFPEAPSALDVRPIFEHPEVADEEYLRDVGTTKRLAEMLSLDQGFRERFLEAPQRSAREAGLDVDVEALRPLWDPDTARRLRALRDAGEAMPTMSLSFERYRSFLREKLGLRDRLRRFGAPAHPQMVEWRARQMRRCHSELGPDKEAGLVHAPVAFELANGCSVGCWFCAVGAQKLTEHARYDEIGGLWQETLHAVDEVIGDAARLGFCYWATEPLDNPDYERFCADFADVLGRFPQTTTAIATRDPERTRRLLAFSQEKGCELNRFSILSIGLQRRVFEAFAPEDLVYVELLPLNKEAGLVKAFSGKARTSRVPRGQQVAPEQAPSTIACVSGFLFNMVDRKIRLVTPCNASDRWENGYWVVDEATFSDGDDVRRQLLAMIERNMPHELDLHRPLSLRPDLRFTTDDGPVLHSTWIRHRLAEIEGIEEIGAMLDAADGRNAIEIASALEREAGVPRTTSMLILGHLFSEGLLDESPAMGEQAAG